LLGFWLAQPQQQQPPAFRVTYVTAAKRMHNLGCYKSGGDYRSPDAADVAVHFVKGPAAHRYVWRVLHARLPHDPFQCSVLAGVA